MQLSDTSTNQGLLQDTYFLCITNSTSYPINDVIRNGNRWLYRAITWALEANPTWDFDDRNLTTHPEVTADLVAGQKDYQLPTNLLKVHAVYAKNSSGDFQKLTQISERDVNVDLDELYSSDGMPVYYELKGGSVFLYPGPAAASVTTTAGLKLSISREIDLFVAADTIQETPLAEPFDRIFSLGAAYDYLVVNGPMERAQTLRAEIEAIKRDMMTFYSGRSRDRKTRLQTLFEKVRNNTIL